jgi:soluble lytic murein transglycosylase-like protein
MNNRVKSYHEFVNEQHGILVSALADAERQAQAVEDREKAENQAAAATNAQINAGVNSTTTTVTNPTTISSGNVIDPNYKPAMFNAVQGNDDFALYMQHQQGMAGAKGLIQALNGTGQMHPDTVKTKSGTRYANLVKNVPSDRPQIKADLIKALNNGDQKTAAGLFLSMWKEKWFSKQKQALAAINLPKNASVKDAITRSSAKYKVPFDFAITVAMIESGLNPLAHGPVYKGLYAMRPESNYGGVVKPMGENWKDPYVNAEAGIALLADNIKQFKKSLGKDLATLNLGGWTQGLA